MTIEVIVRGFLGPKVVFTHPLTVDYSEMESVVARESTENFLAMMAGTIDMVELEFVGFPPHDRYFRIGVNPAGMVIPILIVDPE